MLIYLIRHGKTSWNAEKRYQGAQDIPLSSEGKAQLKTADFAPEMVYITPLMRTRQTAEILFPNAAYQVIPHLQEMCFGDFEGRNYMEMERDADYRSWVAGGCVDACPNGESRDAFSNRCAHAFEQLVNQALEAKQPHLVIVAHGGTQMAICTRYVLSQKDYFNWCGQNGAGYLLDTTHWHENHTLLLQGEINYTKE